MLSGPAGMQHGRLRLTWNQWTQIHWPWAECTYKCWQNWQKWLPNHLLSLQVLGEWEWKKKEDPGNYRPVSLSATPRKVMEQFILDVISRKEDEKKVTGTSQQWLNEGEPCFTNLVAFYDVMTIWVNNTRAIGVVYQAMHLMHSHNIFVMKLRKYGVDEWPLRWTESSKGCDGHRFKLETCS